MCVKTDEKGEKWRISAKIPDVFRRIKFRTVYRSQNAEPVIPIDEFVFVLV